MDGFKSIAKKYKKKYGINIKNAYQIIGIKKSCKIAAEILHKTASIACSGISTKEIDDFANSLHKKFNAIPAPLNYGTPPFPKSICTSINDVICHGIPDDTKLQDGDILNIDVTTIVDGFFGDCSCMVSIGDVSEDKKHLVNVAAECLEKAIEILKPGVLVSAIGERIETFANSKGCSVVYQFVGHGVGLKFHEPPQIAHCRNQMNIPMVEGMVFTIEPMINLGSPEAVVDSEDKWTARTVDGKPSAQWEHTVLITANGSEVLSRL